MENRQTYNSKWFSIQVCCAIFVLILVIIASFLTGKLLSSQTNSNKYNRLVKKEHLLVAEVSNLKNRLTMLESTNQINNKALEQTRQTILLLEQQIYQQQQDITSYKAILAKQKKEPIILFRDFIIQTTNEPDTFRYKLIMTRLDPSNIYIKGILQISIKGTLKGKNETLSLTKITTENNHKKDIPFYFQYMLMIPENSQFAEMVLPNGFKPKKVVITAKILGNKTPVIQEFDWSVQTMAPSTQTTH